MEWTYWKAVVRYGHVGKGKEVSVARYLATPSHTTTIDVMNLIETMPGTKNRALSSIAQIEIEEYLEGSRLEKENFFLQRLFEQRKA